MSWPPFVFSIGWNCSPRPSERPSTNWSPWCPTGAQTLIPPEWYARYGKQVEGIRLPMSRAACEVYALTRGDHGCRFIDALKRPESPAGARKLRSAETLRRTWQRHCECAESTGSPPGLDPVLRLRFNAKP
jgi:hypothetical protein